MLKLDGSFKTFVTTLVSRFPIYSLGLLDFDYDAPCESDFDDDTLSDLDIGGYGSMSYQQHPVNSCLKISKKTCATYKRKKSKTVPTKTVRSPPAKKNGEFVLNNNNNNFESHCGEVLDSSKTTKGSKLYKSTIEGEFDLDKSDSFRLENFILGSRN